MRRREVRREGTVARLAQSLTPTHPRGFGRYPKRAAKGEARDHTPNTVPIAPQGREPAAYAALHVCGVRFATDRLDVVERVHEGIEDDRVEVLRALLCIITTASSTGSAAR